MIDWLIQLDHDITLGLNALHTPVLDSVMLFFSSKTVWIPLYVALAVLMFIPKWYGRKSPAFCLGCRIPIWLTGIMGLLAVGLCFGVTEQITNLVKDWVARPRPGSNTFGMAALTALIFRRGWYSAGILTWAALIGFSRIYLAKHFTTDVVCGALAGVLVAFAVYSLYRWVLSLISRKYS